MKRLAALTAFATIALLPPLSAFGEGVLAINNPALNGTSGKVYVDLEAFAANDQVAMSEYGGDWRGNYTPRNGVNLGLGVLRAESGIQWKGYRVGAILRAEGLLQANRDSSDLVQQFKTNVGYTTNRSYLLDAQIKAYEADGAHWSKSFQLESTGSWQTQWGIGMSYLRGRRITLSAVTGEAVAVNATDLGGSALHNNFDTLIKTLPMTAAGVDLASFNAPFGRQATFYGSGYSFDVGWELRNPSSGASFQVAVADLLGRIDWKDVPTNVSGYTTATKDFSVSGYGTIYPTLTRTSSYQSIKQTLDPKWFVALNQPIGNFDVYGAASYTQGFWFTQLGVSRAISPNSRLKVDYDLRFGTVGLAFEHRRLHLSLRMDGLQIDAAKGYGVVASMNIPF